MRWAAGAGSALVTVMVVDKSVLDQVPYQMRSLSQELALKISGDVAAQNSILAADGLAAPGAIKNWANILIRRLTMDPWLPADSSIFPRWVLSSAFVVM